MKNWLWAALLLGSCAVQKKYEPQKKYSPAALRQDFTLFRNILEETHPSLYWYTPKDSMDAYFDEAFRRISDSMTETRFRYLLSYVTAKIRCGHTSVMPSKEAAAYNDRTRAFAFPLTVKTWGDTAVVTSNMNRKDTTLKRGVLLLSVEGKPIRSIIDSFSSHLSRDGYNMTHPYQIISNGRNFSNLYGSIYGLRNRMALEYIDLNGEKKKAVVDVYNPNLDTPRQQVPAPKLSRYQRKKLALEGMRNLKIDTAKGIAYMQVNTFSKGNQLRSFFRRSFRNLKKWQIENLVIDLRGNGGGSVTMSNLLTRYLATKPFKIADSLYATRRSSAYARYRDEYFLNQLFFFFLTQKDKMGRYHFGLYEGKYFRPKTANHFQGYTYVLTGGNTFSAASLVAKSLKTEERVIIVGEETGGGAYGNTAWLIPDVTLPNTRVRFRLPLFRLVIDRTENKGFGIQPEAASLPTVEAIRSNRDYKMEKVLQLIEQRRAAATN